MTIKVRVRFKKKQIIVPIRFRRAESEPPAFDLPDVDERGFAMGKRELTWGKEKDIQGAMVAVTTGETVRVRVLTEELEGDVDLNDLDAGFPPLFAVSTDPKVAAVMAPPNGGPLPASGIFSIKGVLDTRNRAVAIQIHLGSRDGPVLGELEPHIFDLIKLRCAVHRVEIKGVGPKDASAQQIASLFETANAIWRHAGIAFTHQIQPTILRINQAATPGVVTLFTGKAPIKGPDEARPILDPRHVKLHVNVYLVGKILVFDKDPAPIDAAGETLDKAKRAAGFTPGILLSDGATGQALGHELGHFLSLTHSDRDDADVEIRKDFWTHRRLMFSERNNVMFPIDRNKTDLGYGAGKSGCMITVKNVTSDPSDDEVARARRRAKDPF